MLWIGADARKRGHQPVNLAELAARIPGRTRSGTLIRPRGGAGCPAAGAAAYPALPRASCAGWRPTGAGFSDGGIVGLVLAVTRPTAVRSVVGVGVNYTNDAKTVAGIAGMDPGHLEQQAPETAANLARRHDPHHAPGYWRDLLRWTIAANTEGSAYTVEDLSRISVPTLWIAGEDDPWFELDQPLAMKRHIPGAELLIVNHAGHGPQQTHPHLVGPAIVDFLTRSEARQHP